MLNLDDLKDYAMENACSISGHINGLYVQVNYLRVYNDNHEFYDKLQLKTMINARLRVISDAALRELLLKQAFLPCEQSNATKPFAAIAQVSWLQYDHETSTPVTYSYERTYSCCP